MSSAALHVSVSALCRAWLHSWLGVIGRAWGETRSRSRCHSSTGLGLWLRNALSWWWRLGAWGHPFCAVWDAGGRAKRCKPYLMTISSCHVSDILACAFHPMHDLGKTEQPLSMSRRTEHSLGLQLLKIEMVHAGAQVQSLRGVCQGVQHVCKR